MAFIYDLTDTWNAGGVTFNAIKMNVTDTASAAASRLVSLQVGGVERFGVRKDGQGYFAGNVGIGTTSPGARLHLENPSSTVVVRLGTTASNQYLDISRDATTGFSVYNAAQAAPFRAHVWQLGGTEAMRIDASGNVSIGTTTGYAGYGSGRGLTLSNQSSLIFQNASNTWNSTTAGGAVTYFSDNNMYIDAKDSGSNVIFRVNGATERARIDSSGNLLVGTTTLGAVGTVSGVRARSDGRAIISSATDGVLELGYNGGNASGTVAAFYKGGALGGSITTDGSTTSFNTSSDYRLKDIDGPIQNSGAYIDGLKPVQGSWKADGSRFIGLLAHEVQEVSETQIATGEKDGEEMQAMDYSSPEIIANVIAEIQSLRACVAELKGK
jgi:hypothetical protein